MSNLAAEVSKDYSWAEYLHCMEGGSDVVSLPQKKPGAKKDQPLLGFALALGLTVAAVYLSELNFWPFTLRDPLNPSAAPQHPIEPVMLAIILGMIISNLFTLPKSLTP